MAYSFEELVGQVTRAFNAELEEACRVSLEDGQYGVLVIWVGARWNITAGHPSVPAGHVYQATLYAEEELEHFLTSLAAREDVPRTTRYTMPTREQYPAIYPQEG